MRRLWALAFMVATSLACARGASTGSSDHRRPVAVADPISVGAGGPDERAPAKVVAIFPRQARAGAPVVLVVALPGEGDDPASFLASKRYRAVADELGVAFVGVSGPVELGTNAFGWSDDPVENVARVDEALDRVRKRLHLEGRVVLLGFSQGAQAAVDIAARDPDRFAGAIALSPVGLTKGLRELTTTGANASQRYVVTHASFDSFAAYGTAYDDIDALEDLGAHVHSHTAWLYARHALPPDFDVQLPRWIREVHAARAPK